jgi:hypothetical protein
VDFIGEVSHFVLRQRKIAAMRKSTPWCTTMNQRVLETFLRRIVAVTVRGLRRLLRRVAAPGSGPFMAGG